MYLKVLGRITYLMLHKEDHPDPKVTYKIIRRLILEKEVIILFPVLGKWRAVVVQSVPRL
jgi:hypothetical protein